MQPPLWAMPAEEQTQTQLADFMRWLKNKHGLVFADYDALWQWSATETAAFWAAVWQYFDVKSHSPYTSVLSDAPMPHTQWFDGATLNYAEHIFRHKTDKTPALLFASERHPLYKISWDELEQQVLAIANYLRQQGVEKGDTVVGYLPNIPEAVMAFLATASIGAVWSSCSPDFGAASVIDRFQQIQPKVLFAVDGYHYAGKPFSRTEVVEDLMTALPTLKQVVLIPYLDLAYRRSIDKMFERNDAHLNNIQDPSFFSNKTMEDLLTHGEQMFEMFMAEGQKDFEEDPIDPSAAVSISLLMDIYEDKMTYWQALFQDNILAKAAYTEGSSENQQSLTFTPVPFNHPLYVLYSSGTTGMPKAIVHGHGGILLEHMKYLAFHSNLKAGENFFWYSTTGWMMWNFAVSSLLHGATMVIYDGSPTYPDINCLWDLAENAPINHFGTSAPYLINLMKNNWDSFLNYPLTHLKSISSTGSPLPPEAFDYVYKHIKSNVWLSSMSGGTDVCTAWVGGNPFAVVRAGDIQCRCLGCAMESWDESGQPIVGEVGEMVVTKPMPSMPIYFWNDPNFEKYNASYFEMYPNIWRHGDWLKINADGSLTIHGRSDATLNRHGIRIGTAEIYRVLDGIPAIKDALILNLELSGGRHFMPLFVVCTEGSFFDADFKQTINQALKNAYSPRHVPDEIIEIQEVPYTISGKRMEAPVKKILMGMPLEKAVNLGAMRNRDSIDFFIEFAKKFEGERI
jgi:acetoacetyl-CoA synthetase